MRRRDHSIGLYDSQTKTWRHWRNGRAYWLDPNNKPPQWRIRRIMERSEKGRKLLDLIDKVKRRRGFAQ